VPDSVTSTNPVRSLWCLVLCSFLLSSCELYDKIKGSSSSEDTSEQTEYKIDSQYVDTEPQRIEAKTYKLAEPIVWKQQHMKVRLSFDIAERTARGNSTLTLSPHHKSRIVKVDAIGFHLQRDIRLLSDDSTLNIDKITYDSSSFTIRLNKHCLPLDTIQLVFDYEVRPESLMKRGLTERYDQQGLYFINPDRKAENGPTQIWSQGETEYNSTWLPCLDHPNQKTSQEIYLTLDTPYVGLSNGRLVYMLLNGDGTRTFYWKQELKHAPYLAMIAAGNFAIIEDETSAGLPLYYYVEPEFAPYAELIFGKTPQMIEFFSKKFGYNYPWDKYAQVAVRNFVAGAMENTSATTITHRIQKDSIGFNDNNYEDYIAHELGHQWFGDLVTSESWANLTLNEAFATYSEYLWVEESKGIEKASEVLKEMKMDYLREAEYTVHPLVHYAHNENDDMFNRHSYQKGALALHTLRQYLGNALFFEGIKTYLHDNAFKAVDIDHLRHAFEKGSGLDLRAFFDQWFLQANHPTLKVDWNYLDSTNTFTLQLVQEQAENGYGVYNLNIPIAIVTNNGIHHDTIIGKSSREVLELDLQTAPKYCFVDLGNYPLVEMDFQQAEETWFHMIASDDERHRLQAFEELLRQWPSLSEKAQSQYLHHAYSLNRTNGLLDIQILNALKTDSNSHDLLPFLKSPDYQVVAKALRIIAQRENGSRQLFLDFMKLPSHYVKAAAVQGLCDYYDNAIEKELLLESNTRSNYLMYNIAECWAENGSEAVNQRFQELVRLYDRAGINYGKYLGRQSMTFIKNHISFLSNLHEAELISTNQLRSALGALLTSSENVHSVEDHLDVNTLVDQELSRL